MMMMMMMMCKVTQEKVCKVVMVKYLLTLLL